MSGSGPVALEQALGLLEGLAARGERPDRRDCRALLVPLGRALDQDEEAARPWLERARRVVTRLGDAWTEAATQELELACAEHVHAVDERYLGLPNYDFEYTLAARERLEARLKAARALSLDPPAVLLEGVRRADHRLAPWITGRRPGAGPAEPGTVDSS